MLALVLALALGPATARDPDIVAAESAYREERWDDASVLFEAAYRRTGDPKFVYARAQVERRAGRCGVAVPLYEQFLATAPPAEAGAAAQRYLEECRAALPSPDPVAPAPAAPAEATESDRGADLPPPSTPSRPPMRDPAAAVLVATGAAAMVAGSVLVGLAYRDVGDARDEPDDRAYVDRVARARRLEIGGAIALPIGAALVIGGVVRWAVLARRQRASRVQVAVLSGRAMLGFQIAGRFGSSTRR